MGSAVPCPCNTTANTLWIASETAANTGAASVSAVTVSPHPDRIAADNTVQYADGHTPESAPLPGLAAAEAETPDRLCLETAVESTFSNV